MVEQSAKLSNHYNAAIREYGIGLVWLMSIVV